jgi:hypothetical protein
VPESGTPAAAVLAVCTPWLAQFGAIAWADLTITRPDGQRCTLSVPIAAAVPAPPPVSSPPTTEPAPSEPAPARAAFLPDPGKRARKLLAAATPEPLTKKALIKRAGEPYNGHSCRVLRDLIDRGLLVEDRARRVQLPQ